MFMSSGIVITEETWLGGTISTLKNICLLVGGTHHTVCHSLDRFSV